ncbi:UDP-N-acetylglucosamine transferase subunit ALG14 isoform X4 [Narcine bancroftii]|uniref:UDP-N-acetylglucosamine transferase subunit ALG14 isoform X4 n=1 Tax=Narcine bancroftii TaxID=1343680 RepID=UPI0038313ABD
MGWWWWCGGAALVCVLIARIFLAPKRDGTRERAPGSADVLVVVGSGGHTTEILRLVGSLSASYTPRHYVIADTDRMSEDKICAFETARSKEHSEPQIPSTCSYKGTWVFTGWQQSCVTELALHRKTPSLPWSGITDGKSIGASLGHQELSTVKPLESGIQATGSHKQLENK